MEKNWIKIFSSRNFYQSEMIKQVLCEHDIDAVVLNKQVSAYHGMGNVEVYIHQQNFSRAIEVMILNQL